MTDAADQGPELIAELEKASALLAQAREMVGKRVIGQQNVVDLTINALLSGGHGLLVGAPGLAKTRLVEALGTVMGLDASRVQFTPDLMPSDILGAEVLETGADGSRTFKFIEGPVFCQLLMADEINRASPRTQSALLQAMQEKRPKTRLNKKEPIPCPKRSWIGSCCRSMWTTPTAMRSGTFCWPPPGPRILRQSRCSMPPV